MEGRGGWGEGRGGDGFAPPLNEFLDPPLCSGKFRRSVLDSTVKTGADAASDSQ